MCAKIEFRRIQSNNGTIGDHVLIILFKLKNGCELQKYQFENFEACCQYLNENTQDGVIIDPWISETAPLSNAKKLLDKAQKLNVLSNFSSDVMITRLSSCHTPEICPPRLLQSTNTQEPRNYQALLNALAPLSTTLNNRLGMLRRNIIQNQTTSKVQSTFNTTHAM